MKTSSKTDVRQWVEIVNRTWIVHTHLNDSAQDWLDHLDELGDDRLWKSCLLARAMCARRGPIDDPKPWFYAGLFHLATAAEARRFLRNHRLTRATVPALHGDEEIRNWLTSLSPETRALLARLRAALAELRPPETES